MADLKEVFAISRGIVHIDLVLLLVAALLPVDIDVEESHFALELIKFSPSDSIAIRNHGSCYES